MSISVSSVLVYSIDGEVVRIIATNDVLTSKNVRQIQSDDSSAALYVSTTRRFPDERTIELATALAERLNRAASTEVPSGIVVIGALDGERVIPTGNIVTLLTVARRAGFERAIIPHGSQISAKYAGIPFKGVTTVQEAQDALSSGAAFTTCDTVPAVHGTAIHGDFGNLPGYYSARRALEIAAAGHHHTLIIGEKGIGKGRFPRLLTTILPSLSSEQFHEHLAIQSAAGYAPQINEVPFKHVSTGFSSNDVLGAANGRPGALSLAHAGVLHLENVEQFAPPLQRAIAEALITGHRTLCCSTETACTVPSEPLLVGTINTCRGLHCQRCRIFRGCMRYLSPSLLQTFQIGIQIVDTGSAPDALPPEPSPPIRYRVSRARERQAGRYADRRLNGTTQTPNTSEPRIDDDAVPLLETTWEKFPNTEVDHPTVLRIARTIADLDNAASISASHLSEALSYRVPLYNLLARIDTLAA